MSLHLQLSLESSATIAAWLGNPKHPSPSHPFYSTTHTLLWFERAIFFTLTIHYVWTCSTVLLDCLCWLVLRNKENSINLSILCHLCALVDAVPVVVGHKTEMDKDFISHAPYLIWCIFANGKFSTTSLMLLKNGRLDNTVQLLYIVMDIILHYFTFILEKFILGKSNGCKYYDDYDFNHLLPWKKGVNLSWEQNSCYSSRCHPNFIPESQS